MPLCRMCRQCTPNVIRFDFSSSMLLRSCSLDRSKPGCPHDGALDRGPGNLHLVTVTVERFGWADNGIAGGDGRRLVQLTTDERPFGILGSPGNRRDRAKYNACRLNGLTL